MRTELVGATHLKMGTKSDYSPELTCWRPRPWNSEIACGKRWPKANARNTPPLNEFAKLIAVSRYQSIQMSRHKT